MTDEHKPLPVSGYRPQNQTAVDAVNANKATEERILRLLDDLQNGTLNGESFQADGRWLAIARTDLEKGFMALNRAIFQPGRVNL
jgi:hypothetical protein